MTDVEQGNPRRTVVGVDGSPGSRTALEWAMADAARRGVPVEVVSSFPVQLFLADRFLLDAGQLEAVRADTLARADALVGEVRRETGRADVEVDVLAVAGPPAPMLLAASEDAGMLVVGSRGGSVALHCVLAGPCPVMVVPEPDEGGRHASDG